MTGIDLKSPIDFGRKTFTDSLKGSANVHRANSFLTTVRLSSQKTIRQMRSTISGQPSNKNFFLFRSIPLYGLCPDGGEQTSYVLSHDDLTSLGYNGAGSYDIFLKATDAIGLFGIGYGQITIIPEPATLGLMLTGGLAVLRRWR